MLRSLDPDRNLDEWRLAWDSASYFLNSPNTPAWREGLMPLSQALEVLERDDSVPGRYSWYMFKCRKEGYDKGLEEAGGIQSPDKLWHWVESNGGNASKGVYCPPHVEYDSLNLITKVKLSGVVNKPLEDLAAGLNPVCWSQVTKDSKNGSFKESVQVETDNDGNVVFRNGRPVNKAKQPAATESWQGVLLEDIDMHWHRMPINGFKNLLTIDFKYDKDGCAIDLKYSLNQALSSNHIGFDRLGGIDIDSGGAMVKRLLLARSNKEAMKDLDLGSSNPLENVSKGIKELRIPDGAKKRLNKEFLGHPGTPKDWWYVEISKRIRFTNLTPRKHGGLLQAGQIMNYYAPHIVSTWMDQAATMGVFKIHPRG